MYNFTVYIFQHKHPDTSQICAGYFLIPFKRIILNNKLYMRKNIFLLFCVLLCVQTFAQTTLSGRIIQHPGKTPIPFVTVSILTKKDGSLVTGTVTNEKGRFVISGLNSGEYIISSSFIGFKTKNTSILVGELNKILNVGDIELTEESVSLDNVTVTANRQQVAAGLDKKSYDMANNIAQAGGSVLDAMKNMPGITVDQEGKVLLRGSDKVAVLIDGKQSGLTGFGNQKGLDNIPASAIERIEIINNPSARHDAAGMAGVVNIIYKKESRFGFNGDIGFTYGIGALSKRKDDLPTSLKSYSNNNKYIPTLNMNYKMEKLNIYIQSSIINQHRLPNNEFTTRYYDDNTSTASQVDENRKQTHYNVKGGFDWEINQRNSLSVSGIYDYESHKDTSEVGYFDLKTMKSKRNWSFFETEMTGYANVTANHKYKFEEPGHEINTSFQYTKGWEDETYDLYEKSENRVGADQTHIIATEHTYLASIDYIKPLRIGRVESGVKGRFRNMPITYDVIRGNKSPIYEGLGDWSNWKENMGSAYLNLVIERSKYDIEAGLRAEYTKVQYDIAKENIYYSPTTDSYNYFDLFPSIRLTYKINETNKLSLFYNKRIDRPGEGELRIFPKYDDPELLKIGNPYLRPQYTHNIELAYKLLWQSGSVFVAGYHKMINDYFTRIYAADERSTTQNIINKVYQNTGKATNSGVEIIIDQKVTNFWNLSGSINWYRNIIDAYSGIMYFPYERPFSIEKKTDNPWYAKLNNNFSVWKDMQIQLTSIYYAPKNIPQGKELERWGIDLGIKKPICKGRVELLLSASDIFNTMGIRQEISGDGFNALYENFYETQIFSFGVKVKL